jgi:hypothetical protein
MQTVNKPTKTNVFTVVGRDWTLENAPARFRDPEVVTMDLSIRDVENRARLLYAMMCDAHDVRLRRVVQFGSYLLQIRSRFPYGTWKRFLDDQQIHVKHANWAIRMAERLADSTGEMSTEMLNDLMLKHQVRDHLERIVELRAAESVDDLDEFTVSEVHQISVNKVKQALATRKEYLPKHARRPQYGSKDFQIVQKMGYMPPARGHAPLVPVIIDGEEHEGMTWNRREMWKRGTPYMGRDVQRHAGTAFDELYEEDAARTEAENFRTNSSDLKPSFITDNVQQLEFSVLYQAMESIRKFVTLASGAKMSHFCTLKGWIEQEAELFLARIREKFE